MDYNKLKTLVIIAENESITAAARVLRRSQSAISQQIMQLEEELGLRLLERRSGRIFLSPEGEELCRVGAEHLEHIDVALKGLKNEMESVEGHIRLGALQDYGTEFSVGELVGKFGRKFNKITFEIVSGTSHSLEKDLIDKRIDFAFSVVFSQPELFRKFQVVDSEHNLYGSKRYLEKFPIQSYKDLIQAILVDLHRDFLGLAIFVKKNAASLAATLKHRHPDIVAPNLDTCKDIVKSGHGVAMLPDYLVSKEVKSGQIVNVFPKSKSLVGALDLAYRNNRTLRKCEKLFVDFVRENKR